MFTKKQLAECAYKELQKRRQFYPKWIREKKMSAAVATEQTDMMEAVYRVLIRMDEQEIQKLQT